MRAFGEGTRCMPIPITRNRYWAGEDGSIWHAAYLDRYGAWRPEVRLRPRLYGSTADTQRRGKYLCVHVSVNGHTHELAVHRLVAEAWLPDFHWLLEVHHKNGDPTDNRPCNLVCLTRAEHERLHGRDVTDYDIVNARYDFELHRDDPRPDPFSGPVRRKRRRKDTRSQAQTTCNGIGQTIRQAQNLAHRAEAMEARRAREKGEA